MKKVFPFFLIALVAGAILAGCSGSSETTTTEPAKTETAGGDATTTEEKPADEAEAK
jgi:ABC-type glycerol-3-phosphate transport system substrate-binding protein